MIKVTLLQGGIVFNVIQICVNCNAVTQLWSHEFNAASLLNL